MAEKRTRVTEAKLKRAAKVAAETGSSVTVGDFTVHPPGAANANTEDVEAAELQARMNAIGSR